MATLIIQNGETSPPGLALETLRRFGHSIQMVKIWEGESLPDDLGDVDAILCCGGDQSARNDVSDPMIETQCAFLALAHEAGVPILSKIPYVNRFFTNRITSTEEKTLLILLRPEIIIQTENEDILFPGLSDDMNLGASYAP